jgi:transposase-like protein
MERGDNTMWRKYKRYTPAFRHKVMKELLNGPETNQELVQKYGMSRSLLSIWMRRYGPLEEEEEDSRMLKARIAELEQMVGRLTMENAFLKKFETYARSKTSEATSIVTAKSLKASAGPVSSLGYPAAHTITGLEEREPKRTGLKSG